MKQLRLNGVRQNNLKNINVEIPLGSFTVICGPSGSGKSSLAFETLFAEGQRRFIESLSNYARQFLNKAPQPDLDEIENIPPAIAIEQKNYVKTSRSTVGTQTEIIDYLRLLFEKLGVPHCPEHGTPIERSSVTDAVDQSIEKLEGQRGYILAPISKKGRLAKGKKLLELMVRDGFLRIMADGKVRDLEPSSSLPAKDFEIVVDRVVFRAEDKGRIADSIAQAYAASQNLNKTFTGGHARLLTLDGKELIVSDENSCTLCGFTFPQITSRLFSFSSPVGACPTCNGFGNLLELDEKKVVPKPSRTIAEGTLQPFAMPSAKQDMKELLAFCKRQKIDIHAPWSDLPAKQRKVIWEGNRHFYGVTGLFEYLETKKYKMHVRVFLARYKSPRTCSDCEGSRLREEAHHIFLDGSSIQELSALTIEKLLARLESLNLSPAEAEISGEILNQLLSRLKFLIDVGVNYLTIDRPTRTLSGGEYQRLNLANQLGMELSQTLYVLDEPTVGLHPRDNDRLIKILKRLQKLDNTLVVVEHDHDVIVNSDNIIELGPGSGNLGGEIIYSGPTKDFYDCKDSNTAAYIHQHAKWAPPRTPRPVVVSQFKYKVELKGCTGHNLKNVTAAFPLRRLVAITGVSGSGKSSLVSQTLYPALKQHLTGENSGALPFRQMKGQDLVKSVILIDQKPIGRSARSNPVSYLKIYDEIRKIMASVPDSKLRGYLPGHFSLNVEGGRCPVCKGDGHEIIDMAFMDDIRLICDECSGKRFKKDILEVRFLGKNIHEILSMTVREAMDFFVNYPKLRRSLSFLREVGLDYIQLGQPAQTLSGGESQRLKIARELNFSEQTNALYILDEPTVGLHFREVELLLNVLNRLIEAGGSVIVIEHNLDVIRQSDYVIEIGPDGGEEGGKLVFAGTPEQLARKKGCATAPYLQPFYPGPKKASKPKATSKRSTL